MYGNDWPRRFAINFCNCILIYYKSASASVSWDVFCLKSSEASCENLILIDFLLDFIQQLSSVSFGKTATPSSRRLKIVESWIGVRSKRKHKFIYGPYYIFLLNLPSLTFISFTMMYDILILIMKNVIWTDNKNVVIRLWRKSINTKSGHWLVEFQQTYDLARLGFTLRWDQCKINKISRSDYIIQSKQWKYEQDTML